MNLKEEITARGLLKQATDEKLFELYDKGGQTLYVGMDPTADSLHLWNFVWFMHALQYMKRWNKLIFIVWGATGMIGDPGGKNAERSFLDEETLAHNVKKIEMQVNHILDNIKDITWWQITSDSFTLINNLDFYRDMNYLEFLRKVGKYITVNNMMHKETVKRRLETDDQSISYTEFSYMLIQGYDFVRLHDEHDCKLQIAGSDQRGNVVTGIELINKISEKENKDAYGATTPLILDSTGKKFGKSEGNALWLSPEKNSPYTIYQYFMNVTDEDVGRYLKIFSVKPLSEIEDIVTQHNTSPELRQWQKSLAYLVTQIIFGLDAANECVFATDFSFSTTEEKINKLKNYSTQEIDILCEQLDSCTFPEEWEFITAFLSAEEFWCNFASSKWEAKKLIQWWAISLNWKKITDIWFKITKDCCFENNVAFIQKWKKNYKIIRLDY